jgi:hypothetical protein
MSGTTSTTDQATPAQTPMLAKTIVSIVVLVIYAAAHYIAWKAGGTQLDIMLGADGNMAAAVVFYWVGSSADSARKTTMMQNNATTAETK